MFCCRLAGARLSLSYACKGRGAPLSLIYTFPQRPGSSREITLIHNIIIGILDKEYDYIFLPRFPRLWENSGKAGIFRRKGRTRKRIAGRIPAEDPSRGLNRHLVRRKLFSSDCLPITGRADCYEPFRHRIPRETALEVHRISPRFILSRSHFRSQA